MELTLDRALQKGIKAHKAGQIQEAERLYTAILKTQPKHPEANHNMGILAVGVGKVHESLPFFKTALEANSSIGQYWLSYIDALIKLRRIVDAKAVFNQAKDKGANGEIFDQLEQQLLEQGLQANKSNILDTTKLDKALRLAKQKLKDGHSEEAKSIYEDILQKFPKHKQALIASKSLTGGVTVIPEDPPSDQLQSIINLYTQGHLEQALYHATEMLEKFPNSAILYNIAGLSNKGLMRFNAAIDSYKQALKVKPNYAEAYNNMGNAQNRKGDLDSSIDNYKQALRVKSDFAEAYNNMGIAQSGKGDLDAAIGSYNSAIKIKPDYAEAYNNKGVSLNGKGESGAAIVSYKQALKLKPDYAEAYNNMGTALQNKGEIDAAKNCYKEAIKIKPNYANAAWNRSSLAENISEAKSWMEHCLQLDQSYLHAKLTLSALRFYEGDKSDFDDLMQSSLKDHPYMRSFSWAFSLPKLPELYFHRWALFDHAVRQSIKGRPFYEFGVWRGEAFRYLIKAFKKGYGFDTFEGIPEDWHDETAGSYSSDGNVPKIQGGEFIVGKFDDTLPTFFLEPRPMASVINFDADLYSSTICALNYAKPVIDQYTILIFDEFIINKNWEQDEYKALNEFCRQNNLTYEVLAISFFTKQAAVRLVGI
tara:strand:- start:1976 stop:3922 length:1947 start_codon:yes stop_codon:yes gene_type:complete